MPDISDDFEKKHRKNLKKYNNKIEAIYNEAINKVSASAAGNSLPGGTFNLSKLPLLNNRVNEVLGEARLKIQAVIVNGIATEWDLSNAKNDVYVDRRMSKWLKSTPQGATFYDPNAKAMEAFTKRQVKGLGLSDRVWNGLKTYKGELEAGLGLGISTGKSATGMASDLKQYLKEPDKLFRRVKKLDKDGKPVLKLSKAALNYHPGQGVYRSSYKNTLRLTGTETNMAYRSADHVRWATLPFVVGQEIRLSNQHPQYDICDRCAGRYPKNFIFMGWHPQCICYKVPIMMNDAEYEKYEDALIEGKDPRVRSENKVTDVPQGFKGFLKDNKARIEGWSTTPYWVRDNFKSGSIDNGLKFKVKPEKLPALIDYSLTDQKMATLKAMGVQMENEHLITPSFNNYLKGFDLETLFTDINQIGKDHGITWGLQKIIANGATNDTFFIIKHIGQSKYGEAYLERHFKINNGKTEAYHAYFKIPEKLQGSGISKKVLKAYYDQYVNAGIDRVSVYANLEVGGYTWAKYGFSSMDKYDVLNIISNKSYMMNIDQFQLVKNMVTKHFKDFPGQPFLMRNIADLGVGTANHYGKKILLGTDWKGVLELGDANVRRIFEDYLYGKKK